MSLRIVVLVAVQVLLVQVDEDCLPAAPRAKRNKIRRDTSANRLRVMSAERIAV